MTMPQTARANPRYDIRLSAELRVDGRTLTGTTRNLSMGGLCLELERPLKEGAFVRLSLFMVEDDVEAEGARTLDVTGTVQWSAESERGYALGVKFGNLTAAQQLALGSALKAVGADAAQSV
jgi:hypothetical protein